MSNKYLIPLVISFVLVFSIAARAEIPWAGDKTRYLAMGDSIAAGYGAIPATQGYTYLLYQGGAFGNITKVIFANASVPGATSAHVLDHQVPQAIEAFKPDVITITVGGNDVLSILGGVVTIPDALGSFGANLFAILWDLNSGIANPPDIYISNLYTIHGVPGFSDLEVDFVISLFNNIVTSTASAFSNVEVADIHSRFLGKKGLLLIERHDAGFNVHPTNAGYRVIAQAFEDVIVTP